MGSTSRNEAGAVTGLGVAAFPAPAIRSNLPEVIPGPPYAGFAARWRVLGLFATSRILVAADPSSVLRTLEAELDGNTSGLAWRCISDVRSLARETCPSLKSSTREKLAKGRGVKIKDPDVHARAVATLELSAQVAELWTRIRRSGRGPQEGLSDGRRSYLRGLQDLNFF